MTKEDGYPQYVKWSKEDRSYVDYCPDLFPAGGVCHAPTPVEAFAILTEIVEDTVTAAAAQGLPLPPVQTRPVREVDMVA